MERVAVDRLFKTACIYLISIPAGWLLDALHVPLAWMIGPMLAAMAFCIFVTECTVPTPTRFVGQMAVAGSIGLTFTAPVLASLGGQIVAMLIAAVSVGVASVGAAFLLSRLAKMDIVAASLASLPGGPVEMSNLALKYGVAPSQVAFAQIFRVVGLVLTVPPIVVFLSGVTSSPIPMGNRGAIDLVGVALLGVLSCAGGFAFRRLHISNPFFLGALSFSAIATILSWPVAPLPPWGLAGAQVLLGVWLGCTFDREMIQQARVLILPLFISIGALFGACIVVALLLSSVTGTRLQTMILATAPGSATEMALTAKILHEGLATVTAYHLVRLFLIMPSAPLLVALIVRFSDRRARVGGGQEGD